MAATTVVLLGAVETWVSIVVGVGSIVAVTSREPADFASDVCKTAVYEAADLDIDRVVAGPGFCSISPESRISRQKKVFRLIFPSRGLFLAFSIADDRVE